MASDGELLYDYPEVGKRLSIGRTTVYSLVDRGELQSVKIGRRSLISAESLHSYVARLTGAATA
jgi:excisionase family DNA binding protein